MFQLLDVVIIDLIIAVAACKIAGPPGPVRTTVACPIIEISNLQHNYCLLTAIIDNVATINY